MADANPKKVVTGEVRLSYVHLFEPFSSNPNKEKAYSCLLLIPKKDKKTLKDLRRAQQAALSDKFGDRIPKRWKDTIKDGDDSDLEEHPEFENHWLLNVSARLGYPPAIVDRRVQPILDSTEVYSGCYARVSLMAFGFDAEGSKGVSFGLRNVQKLRDGEPLGSVSRAEDDFDELDDDEDDDDYI